MKKIIYVIALSLLFCMAVLIGCGSKEKIYHWAILQNGRRQMSEDQMQRINERLQELGIEGKIEFHYITVEGLVTPEVVEQTYQELDKRMDFVSISPSLVAFTKEEWKNTFQELSEELKNGRMKGFYEKVPEEVWEANQMAGGIYSFSWTKEVRMHGFGFCGQTVERVGKENLIKLTQAQGPEKKEIWEELYQAGGEQAFCQWTGIASQPIPTPEMPTNRRTLDKITNGWRNHYFWMVTDDIGYNYETERFEWLGESEKFEELVHDVIDLHESGYIRYINIDLVREYDADIEAGQVFCGYDNQVEENSLYPVYSLWVPSWEELQLDFRNPVLYVHSFVYKKAREGWQKILDAIGRDEEITEIINENYTMTMTRVLDVSTEMKEGIGTPVPPKVEDIYAFLKEVYGKRVRREVTDFIFNPQPIEDVLKECERRADAYRGTQFIDEGKTWSDCVISVEKVENFWELYKSVMKEGPIHELVEEVNRQYEEWTKN